MEKEMRPYLKRAVNEEEGVRIRDSEVFLYRNKKEIEAISKVRETDDE